MTLTSFYIDNTISDLTQTQDWFGSQLKHIQLHGGAANWSDWLSSTDWLADQFAGQNAEIMWSVPLIPWGANLADAAAGAYNDKYLALAKQFVANFPTEDEIYIRLGWEFNGLNWNSSSAVGQPGNYVEAFREFVDTFRSVSDKFTFEWCPNIGPTDMNPELAYPGDAYVDVIGIDMYYNIKWDSPDAKQAFDWFVNEPYGLQWHADFAAAHGKPIAISEWGMNVDSPEFVALMAKWCTDHDVLYQNYWDSNAAFPGELSEGQYPKAAAAYKALFGEGVVHATASTTLASGKISLSLDGTAAINGTGNSADNFILGNDAANTLNGGSGGHDVLFGLGGNDTLYGGAGNDSLYGGDGNDSIDGGIGNDILDGGAGTDKMTGGTGDDTYYVKDKDTVAEGAGAGNDTVFARGNHTLATNVENLTLQDGGNFAGTGNALNNVIIGNSGDNVLGGGSAGDDTLSGMAGNDTLYGGTGNDSLLGGEGNDIVDGGAGNDILNGGTGTDKMTGGAGNDSYHVDESGDIVYETANAGSDTVYAGLSYSLGAHAENLVLQEGGNFNGTGNDLDNALTGNSGDNLLSGGSAGNDTIYGLGGNDKLFGGTGSDRLEGGAGNDILDGGTGNDTFVGGLGADRFMFGPASGLDSVKDFGAGDSLDISAWLATGKNPTVTTSGGNVYITFDASNRIELVGVALADVQKTDFGFIFV